MTTVGPPGGLSMFSVPSTAAARCASPRNPVPSPAAGVNGPGIRRSRVDEVIDAAGLRAVARRPAGKFSLGMAQRLGIAAALLGDPATVVLDEPVNGLDVEGIRWIRRLLQDLAARGKTVFISSHLMSEIAQTATHLIVIGRGRLIADTSVAELTAGHASLEDAFVDLTEDAVEFRAATFEEEK